MSIVKHAMKNLKSMPYGGAKSVVNPEIELELQKILNDINIIDFNKDREVNESFLYFYQQWIKNSQLNTFAGLDEYKLACFSNGTSESFDKFYLKNNNKRFRIFRGEYMYHPASWKTYFPNWCYLEDDDLHSNDAVVISFPFSDTGDKHVDMDQLLDQCDKLGIPVLIDCAFFGICGGIDFDFSHECITDITFSLSKTLPVANMRIGMRLSKTDDDDSLFVHHKTSYTNRIAAGIGSVLLEHYSADYNYNRYRSSQISLCNQLEINPSSTVIFGISTDKFSEYNRGGPSSRLCLADYLYVGELPNDRH